MLPWQPYKGLKVVQSLMLIYTYHHCQEIHNNKYSIGLLFVATETIEVGLV